MMPHGIYITIAVAMKARLKDLLADWKNAHELGRAESEVYWADQIRDLIDAQTWIHNNTQLRQSLAMHNNTRRIA